MNRPEQDIYKRLDRFKKVDFSTGCWLWTGCKSKSGYGQIQYRRKKIRIHRFSAFLYLGFDLTSELLIRHKNICPNKDCWNPEHLEPGTSADNARDYSLSVTHCSNGHEYTKENTVISKPSANGHGGKKCKECSRIQRKLRRQCA